MSLEQTEREFAELARSLREAHQAFTAGDFLRAESAYKTALQGCDRLYGDDHTDTCLCLQNLSDTYYALRKYHDAIPLLRRLLVARQKVEPANADIASTLFKLSRTYDKLGQYTESEAFFRITARMGEQLYGPDSTFVASTLEGLLKTLRRANKTKEADQLEERLVTLRAKLASGSARGASAMLSHLADTIAPALDAQDRPGAAYGGSGNSAQNTKTYAAGNMPSVLPIGDGPGMPINPIDTFPPSGRPSTPQPYPPGLSQYDTIPPGRSSMPSGFETLPPGQSGGFEAIPQGRRGPGYDSVPPGRGGSGFDTIPPGRKPMGGKNSLSDSIPPGGYSGQNQIIGSQTGEIHRSTSLRFKGEDFDGSRLPAAGTLNDAQRVAIVLSLSLVGFLGFCFYTLVQMKPTSKDAKAGQQQALALLFPDGINHGDKKAPKEDDAAKTKTPIYTSPDGAKQITLLDADHALMTARGQSMNASYTVSQPYILITPEGQTASFSFQKTEDALIDSKGNSLYATWAPEYKISVAMKGLSETATKYYRKFGRYPSTPEQLMDATRIISYTSPLTHEACWPTKRLLLGLDNTFTEVNMTDLANMQAAAKLLHVWKANETIEPCSVEFYRVPIGPRTDAFLIRGSDRTGHILKSSTAGLTDMIVCQGGTIRE